MQQELLLPDLKTPKEVFRDLRNYLAGQFIGATRDDVLLDELLKCLFCKLYIESGKSHAIPETADAIAQAQHVRSVFAQIRGEFPDIYSKDSEILLDPQSIDVVFRNCHFSLLDTANSDPIGDAFEVFAGTESRARAGQFFTPRSVTDLLVEMVDPQPGETVIDPACGAGGFLASVARHFFSSGVDANRIGTLADKTLFGVDKDDYLVKLARLHVSILSSGHSTLLCGDSIAMRNGSESLWDHFPSGGFDVLLTNPPFGTRIVAATSEVLRDFELARKWRREPTGDRLVPTYEMQTRVAPQVLFVERCLSLLNDGGRLGMVLPESVLSNKSYRYVVEYLLERSDVRAVVGMPDALFKTSGKGGTHTKTCLLVAHKRNGKRGTRSVFMAEAKWCGQDSRARAIPHNDLPMIGENFKSYKARRSFDESHLGFKLDKSKVTSSVLCPRYYDPEVARELAKLDRSHRLIPFADLVDEGVVTITTGDELGKLAYGTGEIPFIRTSDISNWELKAGPKHGVSRNHYERLAAKQDVRAHDILMVKDGTYLIGTCAMISGVDTEIVFQSHLYKIRVRENRYGLDPFLLMAILSSTVVQRQIRSKQFTQDIIDSLGERIHELILPIPKSDETRKRISTIVRACVCQRVEARELVREACLSVCS